MSTIMYLRNGWSSWSVVSHLPATGCPGTGGMGESTNYVKSPPCEDLHYLWLQFHEEPRKEGKLLFVYQLVLDRVKSVVLVPLQAVGELLVTLGIGLGLCVAQHRVAGNVHGVSGDVVAHEAQSIGHVVVLAAPAPEQVGESLNGQRKRWVEN